MADNFSMSPPGRSIPPPGDAYSELLLDTRGLAREHAQRREQWFAQLALDRKEEHLFEFEILLKGLACFANPRNHPGPARRTAVVAQDFREPLAITREALARVVALSRILLGERERAFVFQRYLETVIPDDGARTRLVGDALAQDSPSSSLLVLRHAMTHVHEVASGVSRLPRVQFRLFYALSSLAQGEVQRSAYFNPLSALEFRPEFDRITNQRILELTRSIPQDHARRLVALTFLSLFRMLRYLAVMEATAREEPDGRRVGGVVYLVLSVLRSDARALTSYLRHRAGPLLAEGYERALFRVPAAEIGARYDALLADGHRLLDVKASLEGIAANLRLEMRRAFEHELPAPELAPSGDDLRAALHRCVANLRPALQNAVLFLGNSLGGGLDVRRVFDDETAKRAVSERLRRDVWMFAQIVRAFAQKARVAGPGEAQWSGISPLQFVREFLAYFRAMGYPLLRASDYPRVDAFMAAMTGLDEADLLEPGRLAHAVEEAERFHVFLTDLFDQIGRRDELAGVTFDRRAAAEALKLYLGASA